VATQRTGGRAADEGALLTLSGISKSFGPVQALRQVDLEVRGGELLGLVGHNGAGKSTLMNILIGVTSPDRGEIILESQAMDQRYGPAMAHRLGIRCVFQELSLCPNLSAVENALIVHPTLEGTGWKRRAKSLILTQLHDMFPSHGIDVETPVGNLPIGQRQMVEIARAFTESNNLAKLVILDEPTSSLDSSAAQQLLRFLRRTVIDGKACILITHKLTEVLNFAQRVVVMKDAGVVADVSGSGLSRERLFTLMGSVERATLPAQVSSFAGMRRVDVAGEAGRPSELRIEAGETVGLAGLAGHGQKEVLHRIYAASRSGRDKGCRVTGSAAYVSGDRQREGIFPLWSIASNITIASVRSLSRGSFINRQRAASRRSLA
jgi:ribose transport system ATP-binding protein